MKFLLFFIFFISHQAIAEYRVYKYYVKNKNDPNAKAYIITSSLGPTGYASYHGGNKAYSIDLLDTWMCPGYTGDKSGKYCENPHFDILKVK